MSKSTALALAKGLDFATANELYEYIGTSVVNGQRKQAVSLYKKLPDAEKRDCLNYNKELLLEQHYSDLTFAISLMS